MNPIYILGCSAKKLDVPGHARDLYIGPLFKASLAHALSYADEDDIRILSAKHGLVSLDTELAPYDATWKRSPCITTNALATQIPAEWRARRFVLLCGLDYRLALGYAYHMRFRRPMDSYIPMEGLGIGQQLKWLKEQTKEKNG